MSGGKSFNMAEEFADVDFNEARLEKRFVRTDEILKAAERFHAVMQLRRNRNCRCWQLNFLPNQEIGTDQVSHRPGRGYL